MPTGRTVTADFENQICESCGGVDECATAKDGQRSRRQSGRGGRPKPTRKFSFKSKTIQGTAAKFEVMEYDNDTVLITKIVTSKDEIPPMKVFRSFKNYKVLTEQLLLKKSSLFTICREVFSPSDGANVCVRAISIDETIFETLT
jgi:hypothetical protein